MTRLGSDGDNNLADLAADFSGYEVRTARRGGVEVNGLHYRHNDVVTVDGTKLYEIPLANGSTIYALEQGTECGYHAVVGVEIIEEGGSKIYRLK